jgi:hypothetical protein
MKAPGRKHPRYSSQSGQAIIFIIMVVVILFFVAAWTFDIYKMFRIKGLTQDAGDSAAAAAARWQGITLNLVGDLNLMKALAMGSANTNAASVIGDVQARLLYAGPLVAMVAAQQAAKNNGIFVNADFTERLREHALRVRNDYPTTIGTDGTPLFPEPYPGAWTEYADMLDFIVSEGVAAGPDNMRLYTDYEENSHYLLMPGFYDAIAGMNWCWFLDNAPTLLTDYQNFFPCWWTPIPHIEPPQYINSEIFGLELVKLSAPLGSLLGTNQATANAIATNRALPPINASGSWSNTVEWYGFNSGAWSTWSAMDALNGPYPTPLTGTLRPRYNYTGADAAIRIEATARRLTPGAGGTTTSNTITWTAAAKPFGYIEPDRRPNDVPVVLPAFRQARLIPLDASSAGEGGSYNIAWRNHIEIHLPKYLLDGPDASSACSYCRQLVTWEDASFRATGAEWLLRYSDLCDRQGPGGGGRTGGRRRGH